MEELALLAAAGTAAVTRESRTLGTGVVAFDGLRGLGATVGVASLGTLGGFQLDEVGAEGARAQLQVLLSKQDVRIGVPGLVLVKGCVAAFTEGHQVFVGLMTDILVGAMM